MAGRGFLLETSAESPDSLPSCSCCKSDVEADREPLILPGLAGAGSSAGVSSGIHASSGALPSSPRSGHSRRSIVVGAGGRVGAVALAAALCGSAALVILVFGPRSFFTFGVSRNTVDTEKIEILDTTWGHPLLGQGDCDSTCEESLRSANDLMAYWDVDDCGPIGDDANADWCGGVPEDGEMKEVQCKDTVQVPAETCISTAARLLEVRQSSSLLMTRNFLSFNGCRFMWIAYYVCVSTTTSTSTTTTTTEETKEMFLERVKERFPPPVGWTCKKDCPWCARKFEKPLPTPIANGLNGVQLKDVCFEKHPDGLNSVFVIGDWGGLLKWPGFFVTPADHRDPKKFPNNQRDFVNGVDNQAQQLVALQMARRAATSWPDYILNVGDNFYWGGINADCGKPANVVIYADQWKHVFENIYTGPGIDGVPWLGVLGNHDYGGYKFNSAWDQIVGYTWSKGGRWLTPAQYWRVKVWYPGFHIDYFFLDTNVWDSAPIEADPGHNLCNNVHNLYNASCGSQGPTSLADCPGWFTRLWDAQSKWFEDALKLSKADWQIVVTHFPPSWGMSYWKNMVPYGIDLIVTGHKHNQEIHHLEYDNPLRPTAWVVSGGGGGITSQAEPNPTGFDDQYGFVELIITKGEIYLVSISHGGQEMFSTIITPRHKEVGYHA